MYWARLMDYEVNCTDINILLSTTPNPETLWMLQHEDQLYKGIFYHHHNYSLQYPRYMWN